MSQVVFLAGGRATRLRQLGGVLPKALQPVGGVPLLDRLIEAAIGYGARSFHFALGHRHDQVTEHLRRRAIPFTYSLDDLPRGSGTAGALRAAAPYLSDSFLLWLADTLPVGNPRLVLSRPAAPRLATMAVSSAVPDVTPNVVVADGLVTAYDKRGAPGAAFVDAGMYLVRKEILQHIPTGKVDLEQLWPTLSRLGLLQAEELDGMFLDIGTPERLLSAEAALLIAEATDV